MIKSLLNLVCWVWLAKIANRIHCIKLLIRDNKKEIGVKVNQRQRKFKWNGVPQSRRKWWEIRLNRQYVACVNWHNNDCSNEQYFPVSYSTQNRSQTCVTSLSINTNVHTHILIISFRNCSKLFFFLRQTQNGMCTHHCKKEEKKRRKWRFPRYKVFYFRWCIPFFFILFLYPHHTPPLSSQ